MSPPGTAGLFTWTPLAQTAPGTSGQFSNTPIGRLAFGALGAGPYSAIGRIFADGGGNLFAGQNLSMTGSYTVNQDCTVTITLRDMGASVPSLAGTAIRFEGVVQDRGNSVVAVQTNGAGFSQLHMERPALASGCTQMSLSGGFGLSAFGLDFGDDSLVVGGPRTVSPFAFVGRIFADGQGNLIQDSAGGNSPITRRQFLGTYTVNSDCTGTMTLTGSADTSGAPGIPGVPGGGTGTGSGTDLSFILTQAQVSTQPGGPPVTGQPRPEILFVFDDERFSGLGKGR